MSTFKIFWIQVWKAGKRAFLKPEAEKAIVNLIDEGKLQPGKTAKAGGFEVKFIQADEVEGEIRGNGGYIVLPALSEQINIEALGSWIDSTGDFKEVLRVLWIEEQLAIIGEKGTGKNKLLEVITKVFGLPYTDIPGSEDLSSYDFMGKYSPSEKSDQLAKFVDGLIVDWLKKKGLCGIDEPNIIRGGVILRLHSLLDFRRYVTLKEHEGEVIHRKEGSMLALTFNPPKSEYMGVEALNIAFLDRFSVFEITYPESVYEKLIIEGGSHVVLTALNGYEALSTDTLLKIAGKVRAEYMAGGLHDTVSTRQLQQARRLNDCGMTASKVLEIVIKNRFFGAEKVRVSELCEIGATA